MGRLLALDIGIKRVGYAVSDIDQTMAFPRSVINASPKETFFNEIKKIVSEEKIEKIIIGLPLDAENEEGESAKRIRIVGHSIAEATNLPIEYIDESGSTDEALSRIHLRKQRREKGFRDAIAAQIILERYLDSQK